MQFGTQLLYQRYTAITKLLIVEKQKAGFKNRLFYQWLMEEFVFSYN